MSRYVAVSEIMDLMPETRMAALTTDRISGPIALVWQDGELVGLFRDADRARMFASTERQSGVTVEVTHHLAVPGGTL